MIVMLVNNIGSYNCRQDIYDPANKYINHVKVALYSLSKYSDLPVTLFLVDTPQRVGQDLKKLYGNLKIRHLSPSAQDEKVKHDWGGNPLRFVMMREKILAVKWALNDNNNKWVLFIDCDSIIRGSINGLVHQLCLPEVVKASRIVLLHRPREVEEKHKINSGVIGLTNTPETRTLVCKWYEESLVSDKLSCEQEGLWQAYKKMKDKVKLVHLDPRYNCWDWNKDPVIYHCKGKYFDYLPFKALFFPLLWEAQKKIVGKFKYS